MANNDSNEMVICPYDRSHRVLRAHLAIHLTRCTKAKPQKELDMICCPYNITHLVKSEDIDDHILDCKSGEKQQIKFLIEGSSDEESLGPVLEEDENDNEPSDPDNNQD